MQYWVERFANSSVRKEKHFYFLVIAFLVGEMGHVYIWKIVFLDFSLSASTVLYTDRSQYNCRNSLKKHGRILSGSSKDAEKVDGDFVGDIVYENACLSTEIF